MENYDYLAGSTRPPFTLAEIILFLTVIYFFMGTGGIWQTLLAVLLLIYWFALMAGKLWPPPKFNLPVSSLVRESIPKEKKFKANFVWSIKYKVGLWWHFFPVKKYSLTHNRVLEEKILTLQLDHDKCVGCCMCLIVCPHAIFSMNNGSVRIEKRDACMECGACNLRRKNV